MPVLNTVDLTGVSGQSWAAAAREALSEASKTIRNIQKMDIVSTSAVVEDGVITEYLTEVRIFFEVDR